MSRRTARASASPSPGRLRGWARVFGFAADPRSFARYRRFPSPDQSLAVVFEPGLEVAMGWYRHELRLVDARREVVQAFRGLASPLQQAWWSPDSRFVAVPISEPQSGLLVLDVARQRYSAIHFDAYQSTAAVTTRAVRVGVDRSQFAAVFGEEFRPPRDSVFRFPTLQWFALPGAGAWKPGPAFRRAPRPRWEPPPSKELRAYAKQQGIGLPPAGR